MSDETGLPPDRRVLVAAPRGYCAGVDRAVTTVERALASFGAPVYVRKQIVHNKHVVETLESKGAVFVDELAQVPRGALLVFSAHGVSPAVRAEAAQRGLRTIDATCPLVTKVHHEVTRFTGRGLPIVLVGHAGHEEVEGTSGEAPDNVTLVQNVGDVDALSLDPDKPLIWLSQTTLSVDETREIVERLRARFPKLLDPPTDDICYATQNRQSAIKQIAARCELVIVVGSANSSNSMRLVDVALDAGAGAAHRVDDADQLDPAWFEGVATVGVTSGASVPEELLDAVLMRLVELGYPPATEEVLTEETIAFALPTQVRPPIPRGDRHRGVARPDPAAQLR
ncbi:4-hydroxy-3-methylbut-2-enyl diphosphate reductase [Propionibacterium cyclohexanicum]|mgnify:FL=1|uniref:4-hydroxy-3-methylbut-2-enyl diphosphate reductase n=1 Tax=Propionibacterium cyclohexanicum TaxID=64702 RepID=A0A1H9RFW8_9ACTN|nr:4-hydroxy-3-methylbut-2-enyl diphosphate reductase [Propionibacterium cyclohexanicum]SER71608.1 4-hydroxy-3-methylbut-2-enyl diphosphate reductase [Propionibacterium cyclohexanicum]